MGQYTSFIRMRLAALSALPMAGAVAGAWWDERTRLGFTTWRAACRTGGAGSGAGLRFSSLLDFTFQLLPTAVAGLLLGGFALLLLGFVRQHPAHGRHCLAAHAGCALSLPASILLCASTLSVPVMLLADLVLAAAAAHLLASVRLRTSSTPFA